MAVGIDASWDATRAAEIIADHAGLEGAALPMLHAMQAAFGYIPKPALPMIAQALNISRAEIHGIVTFYHDFREAPAGRHTLRLCRAEACQSMGGPALADRLLQRLSLDWGATTPDGSLTIEAVYCLGLCACAPAALLDGEPVGRLDAAMLDDLVAGTATASLP